VTYGLRSRLDTFVTLTGDCRDLDLVAGWSPEGSDVRSWIVVQASYGNGFLERLEHRQQYKINGSRTFQFGKHELSFFGIGYYGFSFVPGLVPIDVPDLHDTIDPRQPYVAVEGVLSRYFRYYLGFRRDEIDFNNDDLNPDWHLRIARVPFAS
jgi:hypothetical protein